MKCCICPEPATSVHQWYLQGEILQYPFCQSCHEKTWNSTSPATQFVQTAQIFPIDDFEFAKAIGDRNDPITQDPNLL